MANLPYTTGNEDKVLGILKMYSRMGNYPLDATSVFNTKEDLLGYINETGSYAYPGQVVAVANGDVKDSTQTDDYSLYVIRSDRTVQEIGKNLTFSSVSEAEAFIAANSSSVSAGELITVADATNNAYILYLIKADKTLLRVSFDQEDIPDVTWENLQNKPTTIAGYGITDAVNSSDVATEATANKLLKLNADGQLPADITGNAATASKVEWTGVQNAPTTVEGYGITNAVKSDEVVTEATANKLLKLNDAGQLPADITGNAATASKVEWTGVQNAPTTVAGYGITDAYTKTEAEKLVSDTATVIRGEIADIKFADIKEKPDTIAGYGITDAYTKTEADNAFVEATEVATEATANKLLKLNSNAKFPANILEGTIPVENLPHGALERCVVVADDTARYALTSDNVQTGDTVKVTETGMMYFVVDDTKLNDALGYEVYTAGSASNVDWGGVTGRPTTLAGYGITDAVNSEDVVDAPAAGKILTLDNTGKLPTSITGDADTVDGKHASDFVAATDVVTEATANKLLKLNADGKLGADITGNAATASSVEWTNVQNKPTEFTPGAHASEDGTYGTGSASMYGHVKLSDSIESTSGVAQGVAATPAAVKAAYDLANGKADSVHTHVSADITDAVDVASVENAGKLLKVAEDGTIKATATAASKVEWTGVQNAPTTIEGYGITDAVNSSEVVTTATANKLLKLNGEGKLAADITGNAATASKVEWTGVQNKPTTISGYGITDAVNSSEVTTTATANKLLKLNGEGKLAADITGNAATASEVNWSGIQNAPTTVEGYGITDVYTKTEANNAFVEATEVATIAEANKLLKLNANGKFDADITGTAAKASEVEWTGVKNTPSTIDGYGITDAVKTSEVATTAEANKLLKLDSEAKLPASILSGIIPFENLPHGALERCVVVATDTARFALTTSSVQTGDTVKVTETGKMYFVVDDSKLNVEAGYEVYTAGTATNVNWSGVTGTPNTLGGYGITDAVNSGDVVTTATANKLLKLNGEGKLDADITGNAATASEVEWTGVQNKPTTISGYGITDAVNSSDVVTAAEANKLLKLNGEGKLDADITGNAATASSVEWANVQNKPGVDSTIAVGSVEPTNLAVGGLWFDTSATA